MPTVKLEFFDPYDFAQTLSEDAEFHNGRMHSLKQEEKYESGPPKMSARFFFRSDDEAREFAQEATRNSRVLKASYVEDVEYKNLPRY